MKSSLTVSFLTSLLFSLNLYAQDISDLCNQVFQDQISFSNSIQTRSSNEITLLTWNAHKFADKNFFFDLKRLSENTDIIMVQEALHSTAWQNAFASHMPFDFSFYKSFCTTEKQATGVMTATRFQLMNNLTIVSPGTEPISFTPKVAGYSQIMVQGQLVHLLNTHGLNFNSGSSFERQIDQLAMFIEKLSGPVIWAGDFNTWSPGRKSYLNDKATTLKLEHLVPTKDPRNLILDHIYARGFTATQIEVLNENSSDHLPMKAILKLK